MHHRVTHDQRDRVLGLLNFPMVGRVYTHSCDRLRVSNINPSVVWSKQGSVFICHHSSAVASVGCPGLYCGHLHSANKAAHWHEFNNKGGVWAVLFFCISSLTHSQNGIWYFWYVINCKWHVYQERKSVLDEDVVVVVVVVDVNSTIK